MLYVNNSVMFEMTVHILGMATLVPNNKGMCLPMWKA
jgi:hypothetical protein